MKAKLLTWKHKDEITLIPVFRICIEYDGKKTYFCIDFTFLIRTISFYIYR